MQKLLVLVLTIALTGTQALYASSGDKTRTSAPKTDTIRFGAEDSFPYAVGHGGAATTQPIASNSDGLHDMAGEGDGQVTSGTPQAPSQPPRHKHHLRNALIVFGACFAMALVIAVASK